MPPPIVLPPAADADPGHGEVRFIGTATTLIRHGGFTILTDPNFLHRGDHAKLGYGLRSKRLTEPACAIADLPPLDAIVLSHHHGDHFDEVAARELDRRTPIVTTGHAARKLRRQGFEAPLPLRTWETQEVRRGSAVVRITALPAKHAPQPLGALLPPVMGSMLEFEGDGRRFRLYVSGDTVLHDDLRTIPRRYPDIDLALLHLGGTKVLGVLVTMDGRQGVRLLQLVRPRTAIPIHYDDYTVFKSPLEDFRRRAGQASLGTSCTYLRHGETHRFEVPTPR